MKLLQLLPLEDGIFLILLKNQNLLPGDMVEILESKKTRSKQALFFLDQVERHIMAGYGRKTLQNLAQAMKDFHCIAVQELAKSITQDLELFEE